MSQHLYILTGGSRGMGLAIAEQLLQKGNTLICISRNTQSRLTEQAQKVGATLEQWSHDLAEGASASFALKNWLEAHSSNEFQSATLINNAGVIPTIAPLSQADPHNLAMALRVGLEAPMQLCAAFLGATENWAVSRKVVNISSGLGRRAMASQAGYCAAKAGMDHFTRCLALDEALKPNGAKVTSLAPGVIDTDMQVQLRGAPADKFPDQNGFQQLKATGMLVTPDEAAKRILNYLARPDFGSNPVSDVRDAP
jgi:NAD(P)-dependent dehydrogenase (short-subunit alcohol dehydrogenase family)